MRKTFTRPANALPLAAALVIAGIGLLTWNQFRAVDKARFWVFHTYAALAAAKDVRIAVGDVDAGERGYLLTGNDTYLRSSRDAGERLERSSDRLQALTKDNPDQQTQLLALTPPLTRKLGEIARTTRLRALAGPDAALEIAASGLGRQLTSDIDATLGAISRNEQKLLDARLAASSRTEKAVSWLSLIGDASAIGLLSLAFGLLASAQRRLRRSAVAQRGLAMELRTSLNSISQGVAVFDLQHRLLRWNHPFPAVLGLTGGQLQTGTPYGTLESMLSRSLMGGAPFLGEEEGLRTGERRPLVHQRVCQADGRGFEVRRTFIRDGGFVMTVADITERTRAQAAMRETQRMQAIGQLTGGIAHDFNNLLAVVMGNLELAIDRLDPGHPARSRLGRAMWGVRRGAALTHQLLAFARKQPLAPAPCDLSAMLVDLVRLLGRTLGEQIEIVLVNPAEIWLALVDAGQVESAVLNLALNARDAMPDGGRLTIEIANAVLDGAYAERQTEVEAGDYVAIQVTDTGTGMTPDVLARAFEPFFTTKEIGKGTGLGLAMVFGFVKQSGGHLEMASEPGAGTRVRLFLPRAVKVAPALAPTDPDAPAPRGSATLLVVEDEVEVREVAVTTLRELGYRVLDAADGPAAMRLLETHGRAIDLALLDIVLPGGMSGGELAHRIRERHPGVRTLFMSGYPGSVPLDEQHIKGALIGKPFERNALARRVAEALRPERARLLAGSSV